MHIVYLGSRLPLTKTFVQAAGRLTATPYPHISKVTSYHEQVNSLAEFKDTLVAHAEADHCLFNGQLSSPLHNESRAGKTLKTEREWVVFDFDKVIGKDAAEVVAKYLPLECQNVSYVVQLSASMFKPNNTLWSGHIFMLLKDPMSEQRLRQWFEYLNFSISALTTQLSLSDSLQALHWPLDRTVAQNSKLIYIAPPRCHGFEPAIKQHITLVKRKLTHLSIASFSPIDTFAVRQKINELRTAAGESEISYELVSFEGHEMLRSTDICDIQGLKASGDHYIRFNLNGGDSYAYFIDLRNPDVIRNFKGEPFFKTADAAPDLYKALRKAAPKALAKPPLEDGSDVLAFFATNRAATIKTGIFDPMNRSLRIDDSTPVAARAWMAEYGLVIKGDLPHMDLIFDPHSLVQYMPGLPVINTFRATEYMVQKPSKPAASTLAEVPPLLNKIMTSMLGSPTPEVYRHFINWLAFVFQFREKTGTAWVLHGRTGTGKGVFVKYILTPLFGSENVRIIQFPLLDTPFNGFLEQALFVVCDEADMSVAANKASLNAKLRHYITDSPIEINQKGVKTYKADSYTNWLFNANERTVVSITADDRRFNIPERQELQMFLNPNEVKQLSEGNELEAFADMLVRWPVDRAAVTKPIVTQARQDMHEATTSINQLVAEALMTGNLQFFVERLPTEAEAASDFGNGRFNPTGLFKANLSRYQNDAEAGRPTVVTEEETFVLFRTLIPDPRFLQDSKTWRKRHYKSLGLDLDKQHRVGADRVRGLRTQWQPASHADSLQPPAKNITPIMKAKTK